MVLTLLKYQPVKPLIRTNTYTVGNCPSGELSGYALRLIDALGKDRESRAYRCLGSSDIVEQAVAGLRGEVEGESTDG